MASSFDVTVRENATSQSQKVALPGFGLPIRTNPPEDERFPHAICDYVNSKPLTGREIRMLEFVNSITDKPSWEEKVFDESIVSKWREEANREIQIDDVRDKFLSSNLFDYCLAELRDKASRFKTYGFVSVLDTDTNCTVAKSDTGISKETGTKLSQLIRPLEDIPDRYKDWHPGSDNQVLNLVHPSLFPVVYGRSTVLSQGRVPLLECARYSVSGGVTKTLAEEPDTTKQMLPSYYSNRTRNIWGAYQWLPSEIKLNEEGKAKITSYINNLHPRDYQELYGILETIIDASIPLWNEVLSSYVDRIRITVDDTGDEDFKIIEGRKYPHDVTPSGTTVIDPDTNELAYELRWDDHYREWKRANCYLQWPEPNTEFVPFAEVVKRSGTKLVDLKKDFKDQGLQIIFKFANIHLTPEKPEYPGGSWHIEGALNEHIAATAIYYFEQDNITESSLAFRHWMDDEEVIEVAPQGEYDSAALFYGVQQDQTNDQDIGAVKTKENRLLVFPNTVQHRVQPFKLEDPQKSGHRKILAMFLVDPHVRILSTANVPPQRKDWWSEEVRQIERFANLPAEIFTKIIADVEDYPMSWEEAVLIREQLMAERAAITTDTCSHRLAHISFCEH